jgi:hypothetical protein
MEQRRKMIMNSRHFTIVRHGLFRRKTNGLLRKCIAATEVPAILEACHDSACGGHLSGQLTGQKILRTWYF